MPRNVYFSQAVRSEQNLYEDLIIESLKIFGQDIYYLPRDLVNRDSILGEDTSSQFDDAYMIEGYIEGTEGFEGQGDLYSKFGLEVRDQATFVLPRRRWDNLVDFGGGQFVLDGSRPMEGDMLFFPKTNSLFEIKLVEFQDPFYQLGKLYVFKLICELAEYSSERINTGRAEIDRVEDDNSIDTYLYQLLAEDGTYIKLEEGGYFITEDFGFKPSTQGDNTDFDTEEVAEDILDFSENNPFGEL